MKCAPRASRAPLRAVSSTSNVLTQSLLTTLSFLPPGPSLNHVTAKVIILLTTHPPRPTVPLPHARIATMAPLKAVPWRTRLHNRVSTDSPASLCRDREEPSVDCELRVILLAVGESTAGNAMSGFIWSAMWELSTTDESVRTAASFVSATFLCAGAAGMDITGL